MRSDKALWGAIVILTLAVFCLSGYLFISSRSYEIEIEFDKAPPNHLLRLAEFSVPGCIVKEALRWQSADWAAVHEKKISGYCTEKVMSILRGFKKERQEKIIIDPFSPNLFDYVEINHLRIAAIVSKQIDPNFYKTMQNSSLDSCIYSLVRETSDLETSIFITKEAEQFCKESLLLRYMTLSPKWQTNPSYYLNKDLEWELPD